MNAPRKSDFWVKLAPLAPLLLLSVSIALFFPKIHRDTDQGADGHAPAHAVGGETDISATISVLPDQSAEPANPRFRDWFAAFTGLPTGSPERAKLVREGLLLAKARKPQMARLIRENPRQALAEALRFDEWATLPDEIKAEVEKPFSAMGSYTYYPICREPGTRLQPGEPTFFASLAMPDGSNLQAYPYGRRDGVFSKRALPVQGIALNGLAAMRDGPLQMVDAAELATVKMLFPDGQADMGRSLVTGLAVGEAATYAVAGGRIYAFADFAEAEELDNELADLDAKPGPFAASTLLADPSYAAANGSLDLPQVQAEAISQASVWTETKKKLFLIRVNFTDKLEEPVTKAAADAVMAESSERIREMSYGKTWVESAASANVYTMPKTFEYYNSDDDKLFHELLSDARNTFRNTRNGLDTSVNIGPVSYPLNGQWSNLGDYDIVGIFRTPKPGEGGVAGGDQLWMMSNTVRVFTHEWGHNYGILHASFWQTTDGSSVGTGSSDEYGDVFDIMGNGPSPQGHFHPQAKVKLNWLDSSQWIDANVTIPTTYRIYPFDDPSTSGAIRGVRVTDSVNPNQCFWVGLRANAVGATHPKQSAYLVWQRPGETRSWLIDTTPNSATGRADSALALGSTFVTPVSQIHITPIESGGNGSDSYIDVRIGLSPSSGNNIPVISESSIGGATSARGIISLSAKATDPEGTPIRYFWDFGPDFPILQGAAPTFILPFGGSYDVTLRVIDANGGLTTFSQTLNLQDPALSFTTRTSGATYNLVAIAANATIAVAVGDANHPILTSSNGSTWTKRTLPEWTYLHDVVWDGGKFIATGHGWRNSVWNNVIYTSADGITWTRRYTAVAGTQLVRSVAAGPGAGAVAVGDNGLFLRSTDGITWSKLPLQALGGMNATDVSWGPSGYVMTAASSNPTVNKVLTSPDGITWTDRSAGTGLDAEWKTLLRTAWLNDRYVAGGWYSGIRSSLDRGNTFAQARTAGNIELRAMAHGNGVYFGAGWDRDNSGVDVDAFSLNGDDWYPFTPGTTRDRLGAVFFKNTFITVGETGEIRQSGPVVRPQEVFALRSPGAVVWDGDQSQTRHAFLALPGQTRVMEYSSDLAGPWQTLAPIETGSMGLFEATFQQTGDQRSAWGKRMFFRMRK